MFIICVFVSNRMISTYDFINVTIVIVDCFAGHHTSPVLTTHYYYYTHSGLGSLGNLGNLANLANTNYRSNKV